MSADLTIWTSEDGNQTITTAADRDGFRTTCPKGHAVDVAMSASDVREMLKHQREDDPDQPSIEVLCSACGELFILPPEAMPNLRRWARKDCY